MWLFLPFPICRKLDSDIMFYVKCIGFFKNLGLSAGMLGLRCFSNFYQAISLQENLQ